MKMAQHPILIYGRKNINSYINLNLSFLHFTLEHLDGGVVYNSDRSLGKAACNFTTGLYNPLTKKVILIL